tara:strand:+ start:41489 stop:41935 length:447 start_codon:yes stop_codon:yes gene_type:complete
MIFIADTEAMLRIIIQSGKRYNKTIDKDHMSIVLINNSYHIFKIENGKDVIAHINFSSSKITERFRMFSMYKINFCSTTDICFGNAALVSEAFLMGITDEIYEINREIKKHSPETWGANPTFDKTGFEPRFKKLYSSIKTYYNSLLNN